MKKRNQKVHFNICNIENSATFIFEFNLIRGENAWGKWSRFYLLFMRRLLLTCLLYGSAACIMNEGVVVKSEGLGKDGI